MDIKDGDYVRIQKGSVVKSYNPSKPEYVLSKSQRVHVVYQYNTINSIVWACTGGYWCWTDKSNIIEIEKPDTVKDRFESDENLCYSCVWMDRVSDHEFPCSHCIHNVNHV